MIHILGAVMLIRTTKCLGLMMALLGFALMNVQQLAAQSEPAPLESIEKKTAGMMRLDGYFPFYWDDSAGKIWLEISRWDESFLYVHSLSRGLGSNPVGLDRGQLGASRVVSFRRIGPKVLLVHHNLRYRAETDNSAERQAVEQSFASSILWAGQVGARSGDRVLVDFTSFLLRDAHGVTATLQRTGQGSFLLDQDRSAVVPDSCKAFPRNCEFESMLTFSSASPGALVRQTAPTAQAVTLRQHHSLVQLPDDGYKRRRFDPRVGTFKISYSDYAAPIDRPMEKHWITRHRLQKRDPGAELSAPVEPIVYYVDPGAPEPIRQALLDGARWWNAAFESAGFRDAFQVRLLPSGADPMDVRYNVIQWVHRSTRGWSYGQSVVDPRTGEIIKGHVLLGSLRVRQDHLLFEGLRGSVGTEASCSCCGGMFAVAEESSLSSLDSNTDSVEVALARIRQLAAHEVGHTLGFAHNFAASTYADRASVMDYPAPRIKIRDGNQLDLSDAYGVGVGRWDHFTVQYAYMEFGADEDEQQKLDEMVAASIRQGMLYITDADARPAGAAHPLANLWDDGSDPVQSLRHAMQVRRIALDRFGEVQVGPHQPVSELETMLVPVYLHHRYQVDATAKMLGGVYYSYAVQGDGQTPLQLVPVDQQRAALAALLQTIAPDQLVIDPKILSRIPPKPYSSIRDNERFPGRTAMVFDPLAAAENAAQMTVRNLLQPERANRLAATPGDFSLQQVLDQLLEATWFQPAPQDPAQAAVARVVQRVVLQQLFNLIEHDSAYPDTRAIASRQLTGLHQWLNTQPGVNLDETSQAHRALAAQDIERFLSRPHQPAETPPSLQLPPGSPIGGR